MSETDCFGYPDELCRWDHCPDYDRCLAVMAERERTEAVLMGPKCG